MNRVKAVQRGSIVARQSFGVLNCMIGLVVIALITACCSGVHLSGNCKAHHVDSGDRLLQKYRQSSFPCAGFRHDVYYRSPSVIGDAPAVLVLHELPGLTHECLELADRFVDAGFAVYLPLFFGKPEPEFAGNWTNLRNTIFITLSNEWMPNRTSVSQPITRWLRGLIEQKIAVEHPNHKIGVAGMCLTGALPVALLSERSVGAAVVCQPSLPLNACTHAARSNLGIADAELEAAVHNSDAPIYGLRFEKDTISKAERFLTLKKRFGNRFINRQIKWPSEYEVGATRIPIHAHATLTQCFTDSNNKPYPQLRQRRDEVVAFLHRFLDK